MPTQEPELGSCEGHPHVSEEPAQLSCCCPSAPDAPWTDAPSPPSSARYTPSSSVPSTPPAWLSPGGPCRSSSTPSSKKLLAGADAATTRPTAHRPGSCWLREPAYAWCHAVKDSMQRWGCSYFRAGSASARK